MSHERSANVQMLKWRPNHVHCSPGEITHSLAAFFPKILCKTWLRTWLSPLRYDGNSVWAMKDKWCELCAAKGLQKKLKYCHVNFKEGIYMCENDMCIYPFGSTAVDSLLAKRSSRPSDQNAGKHTKNDVRIPEEKTLKRKQCSSNNLESLFHWSNQDALCWLDSVMTLLVHNKCLQLCLEKLTPKESILEKLYSKFTQAQRLGPVEEGKALLNKARMEVFDFLNPKMKCKLGVNDSPVASLKLLLQDNPQIGEKFAQDYQWNFKCETCGYVQVNRYKKWIVSFPNTTNDFCMPSAGFLRPCYKCKSPGQRSTLEYKQFPPCLVVHFVEGVSSEEILKSRFIAQDKVYELSQLVQYKRNPDHFVAWVRSSNGTEWAEVDDLKDVVSKWRKGVPCLPVNQIHIAVWERASLYRKNFESAEAMNQCETTKRKHSTSSNVLLREPNKQISLPSKTCRLKDPPLLRRTHQNLSVLKASENQVSPTSRSLQVLKASGALVNTASCNFSILKRNKAELGSSINGLLMDCKGGTDISQKDRRVTANSESHDNVSKNKRQNSECFEPYIPRKKRYLADGEVANNVFSGSLESASTLPDENLTSTISLACNISETVKGSSCSVNTDVDNTTNFPPWRDISVNGEEKDEKQSVGDHQTDSGYSSPGSNSSCLSLPLVSSKETFSLNEFLDSLDALDLPDIVNSSRQRANSQDVSCEPNAKEQNHDVLDELFDHNLSKDMVPRGESGTPIDGGSTSDICPVPPDIVFDSDSPTDLSWLDSVSNFDDFLAKF